MLATPAERTQWTLRSLKGVRTSNDFSPTKPWNARAPVNFAADHAPLRSVLLLGCLPMTACLSDSTGPPQARLADTVWIGAPVPPLVAYQNGNLVLGRVVRGPCPPPRGAWIMDFLPSGQPMTLDLYYWNHSPSDSFPDLTQANLREVQRSRVRILRAFNMGVIRVSANRRQLLWLAPDMALAVPRLDRFEVEVSVGYEDSSVVDYFEELGGAITYEFPTIDAFTGVLPDDRIPELRDHQAVEYVEHSTLGCVG